MSTSRSLPNRQPARAIVVLALYLVAVAVGTGLLHLRFSTALSWLLAAMWAVALLIPLAILAPRAPGVRAPGSTTPVLQRPRREPRHDPRS
ncbi:MAG: hypothetical protein ACR2K2_07880 [Mycobacteriales bacterium]